MANDISRTHPQTHTMFVFSYEAPEYSGSNAAPLHYTVGWKMPKTADAQEKLESVLFRFKRAQWDGVLEKMSDQDFMRNDYTDPGNARYMPAIMVKKADGDLDSVTYMTDNRESNTGPAGVSHLKFTENKVSHVQRVQRDSVHPQKHADYETCRAAHAAFFGDEAANILDFLNVKAANAPTAADRKKKNNYGVR